MKKLMVTGSSGLIGSEVVSYFASSGWQVFGVDNNMRADFFGAEGDTRWNQNRLAAKFPNFSHCEMDIRDRKGVSAIVSSIRPNLILHAAAQPSARTPAEPPAAGTSASC